MKQQNMVLYGAYLSFPLSEDFSLVLPTQPYPKTFLVPLVQVLLHDLMHGSYQTVHPR